MHFMGLKRAKTKLHNLRSEHFETSGVELGLLFELLTLTQLKVVHFVEVSERPKITAFCSSLEILIPYPLPFHSGVQDVK